MGFIKYSIGGKITSVVEVDGMEEREDDGRDLSCIGVQVCNKCGLQHMIVRSETDTICSCGNTLKTN